MSGQITTKTFHGGMNKDVDISLLKENEYINAENYKLVADEASNGYILENAEGNSLWLDLSGISGLDDTYYLIGHCFIKPYLVLFYTTVTNDTAPSGGTSKIVRMTLDGDKIQESVIIYEDGVNSTYLDLSDTYPITAVGYYEAPDNIKVYWTDNYNYVRIINIMDAELENYNAGMLDIVPEFPLSNSIQVRPELASTLVPGQIKACSVQYAYQYYLKHGVRTLWSPPSKMQVIPVNNEITSFSDYKGGLKDEVTGYGVQVTVHVPSENLYTNMRVVAIQYDTYNAIPTMRVIYDTSVQTEETYDITITDSGEFLSEITYDEFLVSNNVTYRCKDLSAKDNRLFLANVHETLYDVDFDARAYRFNSVGKARLWEADNVLYQDIYSPTASVDEDHDCINRYNSSDYETASLYKFQSDGKTLGAEGPNMVLGFDVGGQTLDTSGVDDTLTTTNNITLTDSSPYLFSPGRKSWQRQETYRLGVVFRNNKMQVSPVKWVCDLKMPTYTESESELILGEVIVKNFYHLSTSGSTISANQLSIMATISNFEATGASTWELVCVPREGDLDRSVLGQGLLQPACERGDGAWFPHWVMEKETISTYPTGFYLEDMSWNTIGYFSSPEVSFNKNLEYRAGDFFQKIGYFQVGADYELDETAAYESVHYKVWNFYAQDGAYRAEEKLVLDNGKIIPYDSNSTNRYSVGSESVSGYHLVGGDAESAIGNTIYASVFDSAPSSDFIDQATALNKVPVVNYRRNVWLSQYGGPTYIDRADNIYTIASDPATSDTTITTYEGDVFIDYFSQVRFSLDTILANEGDYSNAVTFLFPVESTIATRLNHSDSIYRKVSTKEGRLAQEIAGEWTAEIDSTTFTLKQEFPLYQYNSAYSQLSKATLFIADNEDFEQINRYSIRVINSEYKTNNEELDSFTQFKPNNFLDLDGSRGVINNLKNFKNQLFFWQDTGFGIASVNTRALIQDNQVGLLALGTGGILERYDYISDSIGNQNQFGIVNSKTALYWVDNNKSEFFKYDGKVQSMSKLGGVQTWVNGLGKIGDAKLVYDHKYNDVIFTVTFSRELTCIGDLSVYAWTFDVGDQTGLSNDVLYNCIVNGRYIDTLMAPERNVITSFAAAPTTWTIHVHPYGAVGSEFNMTIDQDPTLTRTLTFNERINKFTSHNSFTPGKYIETDYGYYSTNDYHDLYQHNDGGADRATYFGTTYDSVITTSFNENYPYTKVWDGLKWVSESVDSDDINQFKDTFDRLDIYDDYQHTGGRRLYFQGDTAVGAPFLYAHPVSRRQRTWSTSIPRSIIDADVSDNPDIFSTSNWDNTQTFKERMRDKYITIKSTYYNEDGNVFSIPFISSIYRRSVR